MIKIKRVLMSVFDKTGIVDFAKGLQKWDVEIVSTGGTFRLLEKEGIAVTPIDDVTKFPEMMDGRLKTLHPAVHGGLLAVRDNEKHMQQMQENDITPIDMAVINLYPFEKIIENKSVPTEVAIENIDIGGPTMLRSAAKNYRYVASVCDVRDYDGILEELEANKGSLTEETRFCLSQKVFALTSGYDHAIQAFLGGRNGKLTKGFPDKLTLGFEKIMPLRYGENPHQEAAFYRSSELRGEIPFEKLHGKELSYNNILDFYASLSILKEFSDPVACVIKHNNPCGICENKSLKKAVSGAIDSDPVSAFGGIVGLNQKCTEDVVKVLFQKLSFFEMIVAPGFTPGALKQLKAKKNLRIIKIKNSQLKAIPGGRDYIYLSGFLLSQESDPPVLKSEKVLRKSLKLPTKKKPAKKDLDELLFAWKCAKVVKSNSIVITKDKQTIGIGAGQMSRVGSMAIACRQAGKKAKGAFAASDGFFPMPDNITVAAKYGIKAMIQPGGSIKDPAVIEAANKKKMIMVMTGKRHFKH